MGQKEKRPLSSFRGKSSFHIMIEDHPSGKEERELKKMLDVAHSCEGYHAITSSSFLVFI